MTQSRKKIVCVTINDRSYEIAAEPEAILLDFVREQVGLTGTKRGCDAGECGCCTLLVDGKNVLSCLTLAAEVDGKKIVTIEGVAKGEELHPVQQAFIDHGALQCGFCTPAMVLNAVKLLEENPTPDAAAIKTCISGTICRCTGYTKIEEAVAAAAKKIGASTSHGGSAIDRPMVGQR